MYKRAKTMDELKKTRIKTTFKVELEFDLPYLDNKSWIDQRLEEVMKEVYDRISKRDTDGHFDGEDCYNMTHRYEAFYGYDEEVEYMIDEHENI